MKKFVYNLMFIAVAVLSVAGFSSCNNADDDPRVITPQPATAQEQAATQVTPVYAAAVSGEILDMYDISLVLHSGDKSKEVELTKSNCSKTELNPNNSKVTIYEYFFKDVDGQSGVSYAEAKVTPKANIKTFLENLPADEHINISYAARMINTAYLSNNKFMTDVIFNLNLAFLSFLPGELLMDMGDGTLTCEYQAEILKTVLSR